MEKIQNAIAKARSQRAAQGAAEAEAAAAAAPPPAPAEAEEASASIPAPTPAPAPPSEPGAAEPAPSPPQPQPQPQPAPPPPLQTSERRWSEIAPFRPSGRTLRRSRLVAASGGIGASGFDGIRTRVLQLQRAHGWTRIAVTSPDPRCGKSTVSLNLAWSLSRQREQRTIVFETDLRRPTLARMIGHSGKHDFAGVLEGRAGFEDNALRIGDNLIVATNNRIPRNPAEILHGPAAAAALDDIADRYAPTVMLFDLPPMLAVDDALAFLPLVDAVILVAAAEQTTIKQIDRCEREIAAVTNVMGVVLNKCRYLDPEQSYDYTY